MSLNKKQNQFIGFSKNSTIEINNLRAVKRNETVKRIIILKNPSG